MSKRDIMETNSWAYSKHTALLQSIESIIFLGFLILVISSTTNITAAIISTINPVNKTNEITSHEAVVINNSKLAKYYDKVLASQPSNLFALTGKGEALSNLGNYTGAIKYYD